MTKRVAIYVRVSTGSQTVENQKRDLLAVAERAGWDIVRIYEDQAVSGGKTGHSRPAFKAMCMDASRHQFDVVAAWSVDRISRNLRDLLAFAAELEALNIDLFLQAQALDTSTPSGRAMFAMCGVFGELERAVIRERVLSGLNRARAAGKRLGRPRVSAELEVRVRAALASGNQGIRKIAREFQIGTGTVQRIKTEMVAV